MPSVIASYTPHGKKERVKMRLPLISSVQQIQEAINQGNTDRSKDLGLFLPTKNNHPICLRANYPLWRYHIDSNAFSDLSIRSSFDNLDRNRIGLVVLNRKDQKGGGVGATLFSFPRDALTLDVIDMINDTFSLNLDLKFYGLFVYEKKNRGKFVGLKKTLFENGIGEMMIVEVRHLSLFELIEQNPINPSKPLHFTLRDNVITDDLLKELSQGLSPTSSPLTLLHLPYGEESSVKNWLPPGQQLKSCRIGMGSLLVVCDSTMEGGNQGTKKRGTTHRAMYVKQSPFPAHHNWRSKPNHPDRLVGEKVEGTIHNVLLVRPGGERVKGDLHVTNANVVFGAFSSTFSAYASFCVTPLLSIARIELAQGGAHGVDLYCKNVRTVRFLLDSKTSQRSYLMQMLDKLVFPARTREIFAFAMKAAFQERDDGWDLFPGFLFLYYSH